MHLEGMNHNDSWTRFNAPRLTSPFGLATTSCQTTMRATRASATKSTQPSKPLALIMSKESQLETSSCLTTSMLMVLAYPIQILTLVIKVHNI
jgi:hypothetical protein